jgi:uncharacterized protein (DUF3820 family)
MTTTYTQAAAFVMPFGKYKGLSLDKIAETDEGLRYLDWMRGDAYAPHIREIIGAYLDDPTIANEVARLVKWK